MRDFHLNLYRLAETSQKADYGFLYRRIPFLHPSSYVRERRSDSQMFDVRYEWTIYHDGRIHVEAAHCQAALGPFG